jgi:hypothetical protein
LGLVECGPEVLTVEQGVRRMSDREVEPIGH